MNGSSPWCPPCRSYHPAPRDAAHKAALRCFAPEDDPPPELVGDDALHDAVRERVDSLSGADLEKLARRIIAADTIEAWEAADPEEPEPHEWANLLIEEVDLETLRSEIGVKVRPPDPGPPAGSF